MLIGRQSHANHMFPVTRQSWPNCGKISRPLIGWKPRASGMTSQVGINDFELTIPN